MKIKKCPRCKSLNIDLFMGGYSGAYKCQDCGYRGPLIIEEEIDEKSIKKKKSSK